MNEKQKASSITHINEQNDSEKAYKNAPLQHNQHNNHPNQINLKSIEDNDHLLYLGMTNRTTKEMETRRAMNAYKSQYNGDLESLLHSDPEITSKILELQELGNFTVIIY